MTGLDPTQDKIMELAICVTTPELESLTKIENFVIRIEERDVRLMNNFVRKMHDKSNLTNECLGRVPAVKTYDLLEVERICCRILSQYSEHRLYIAGNSVYMDKYFLEVHCPKLNSMLHYRIIDVSTMKTLLTAWKGTKRFHKQSAHRAAQDIDESLSELRYFKQLIS
ncbi:hypothetical protein SNEBB_001603 [Seison nebaliae]|nr:hypothetical protein SNEBB_001603 [Seison nebaliae]